MQNSINLIASRRIIDRSAGPKMASKLACRFLVGGGVAMAGALLNLDMAYARAAPCGPYMREQECCSLEDCKGHVLGSNASAKECKKKYHGKSWHPALDGGHEAECRNF